MSIKRALRNLQLLFTFVFPPRTNPIYPHHCTFLHLMGKNADIFINFDHFSNIQTFILKFPHTILEYKDFSSNYKFYQLSEFYQCIRFESKKSRIVERGKISPLCYVSCMKKEIKLVQRMNIQ